MGREGLKKIRDQIYTDMKNYITIGVLAIAMLGACTHAPSTLDISKEWKFSPDTGNAGMQEQWYAPAFDDAGWKILDAGLRWEDQGYPDLDGYGWYRKTVTVPKQWKGKKVWIKFGAVNDAYDLFINGRQVSSYGASKYSFAGKPSFTEVSKDLLYGRSNLIAVRVNDWGNSGGLWRLPVILTTDKKETDLYKPLSDKPFDPEKEGYKLYWQDEFDGNRLDTTKWKNRALGVRRGGFGTPDAVEVQGGYLKIRAYMQHDTLMVGAVSTEGIKGFRYGYFECRARLPKTTGPWAAFWIQSPKISQGEDPGQYGTEIDIFEYFRRQGGDFISHNLHWAYGPHQKSSGPFLSRVPGIGEGFHTFALQWTPEKYAFFIDGLKYQETRQAVSHIPENIILSYEPCARKDLDVTELPDSFVVDYVRVYQRKDESHLR